MAFYPTFKEDDHHANNQDPAKKILMNNCPKCGSPQESPKLDGTTARIWFTCGSYGYADKPDQVFRSSDKCLDREEINTLQRKVEELQVALDFANEAVDQRERSCKEKEAKLDNFQASTIHSCGDSCSRPMCVLRRERDAYKEALQMCVFWAESISRRVTEDRDSINWTGLQIARKALADIQKEAK